jgi:hypothetical protein
MPAIQKLILNSFFLLPGNYFTTSKNSSFLSDVWADLSGGNSRIPMITDLDFTSCYSFCYSDIYLQLIIIICEAMIFTNCPWHCCSTRSLQGFLLPASHIFEVARDLGFIPEKQIHLWPKLK